MGLITTIAYITLPERYAAKFCIGVRHSCPNLTYTRRYKDYKLKGKQKCQFTEPFPSIGEYHYGDHQWYGVWG